MSSVLFPKINRKTMSRQEKRRKGSSNKSGSHVSIVEHVFCICQGQNVTGLLTAINLQRIEGNLEYGEGIYDL